MSAPQIKIHYSRPAIFDWVVIIASALLGFVYPNLRDFVKSPGFFDWMLTGLLLYIVGSALKDFPLSYRLRTSSQTPRMVPYILFLLIGHWFIIMVWVILAEPAIRNWLSLEPLTDANSASAATIFGSIAVATIVTWLVYRTKGKRRNKKIYSAKLIYWWELIADILLIAGVTIFSFVAWEKGAMAMLGNGTTKTVGDIWFIFVFFGILFLFVYLPIRYLYFIEEKPGTNRRRLFYIFGFLMLRVLFNLLSF